MNTDNILKLAKVYCAHHGYALSTIATYSVDDGKFFARLERGGSCTLKIAARIMQWFSDNWPDQEVDWPAGIERPSRRKEAG